MEMDPDLSPTQIVLRMPELLNTIFEYLDPKTVLKARTVCRQWRSVSELYLKRRLTVEDNGVVKLIVDKLALVSITLSDKVQRRNFFNKSYGLPLVDEFGLRISGLSGKITRIGKKLEYNPALFIPILLEVDWPTNLKVLTIYECITVEDWMTIGVAVLKKIKALSSLIVTFIEERNHVVPLCFTELQEQNDDQEEFQNLRLTRILIKFTDHQPSDRIVQDIYEMCPNLHTFAVIGFGTRVTASMCRRTVWDIAKAESVSDWNCEIKVGESVRELNFPWLKVLGALLSRTPLRNISVPLSFDIICALEIKPCVTEQLEVVSLSHMKRAVDRFQILTNSIAFQNVRSLFWELQLAENDDSTFVIIQPDCEGTIVLPNLLTLQLQRETDSKTIAPADGFPADNWILQHFHKLAPGVEKLIVNVYNRCNARWRGFRGDCQNVLNIAKSFDKLKHLVLINNQFTRFSKCTNLKVTEAAPCITGLASLTLAVKDSSLLYAYADFFLNTWKKEKVNPVLRLLGLYMHNIPGLDRQVDLTQLKVAVPKHVTLKTGIWTKEMMKEEFEEIK